MIVANLHDSKPFTTKDGSEVRSILDRANAPVRHQSLAEATLPPNGSTSKHRHPRSEEIYYILSGHGSMTVGDETRDVVPHDAILTPPGVPHELVNTCGESLVFLCCCAPPYSHQDTIMEKETED